MLVRVKVIRKTILFNCFYIHYLSIDCFISSRIACLMIAMKNRNFSGEKHLVSKHIQMKTNSFDTNIMTFLMLSQCFTMVTFSGILYYFLLSSCLLFQSIFSLSLFLVVIHSRRLLDKYYQQTQFYDKLVVTSDHSLCTY